MCALPIPTVFEAVSLFFDINPKRSREEKKKIETAAHVFAILSILYLLWNGLFYMTETIFLSWMFGAYIAQYTTNSGLLHSDYHKVIFDPVEDL